MGWPFRDDLQKGDPLHRLRADDIVTMMRIFNDLRGNGCTIEKTPHGYGWTISVASGGGATAADERSIDYNEQGATQIYGADTAVADTNITEYCSIPYRDSAYIGGDSDNTMHWAAPSALIESGVRGTKALFKVIMLRAYYTADDSLVDASTPYDSGTMYLYPTWDYPRMR